ncbi:branched-chain amino acid ABC transporter permease [Amorphus orientalis]|uniref:Branched-chain amino acid transport system permease protein n=1 Tax=Amorphus orientalis TaxID=649198 RepID=A0AAE3VRA3_9HYPH|nr:branched-chain amino acid ABC transporter permease [Amorphus orientalis]MDQ0316892.1 branched-chain amino acid transport system permease protein [Amorphus orientalis]
MSRSRWISSLILTFSIPLVAVAAAFASDAGTQYLIALILVWSIFAVGFDLVFGVAGILSFGHAAFFGAGAYVYAVLTLDYGVSGLAALGAAVAMGTVMGALFGVVTLRVTGIYLALTTLALAQLVHHLVEVKLKGITGGTDGLAGVPRPELFGIDFYDDRMFVVFVAAIFFVLMFANAVMRASPFGEVLRAMRQNEVRVEQLGYDVRLYKLSAFAISGGYSGIAGGLLGALVMYVGPEMTRWITSGDVLIMTVLGGRGTFAGPVLGVVVFEWLKESVSGYTEHWYGVLGIVFILITLYMPGGLIGLLSRLTKRRAQPRRPRRADAERASGRSSEAA